jgi:hypothetical protein
MGSTKYRCKVQPTYYLADVEQRNKEERKKEGRKENSAVVVEVMHFGVLKDHVLYV